MHAMRVLPAILVLSLVAVGLLGPAAAHERYFSSDDKYLIVLGEQNEPVYTYDWTNLDLIISKNATEEAPGAGDGDSSAVTGVEETLQATIIAPNGEGMTMALEPQHGSEGRYAFVEDYFLTLPGQYKVRLEGDINGTNVTGEYLLPGPRGELKAQAFPVPLEKDLRELQAENGDLREQIASLEERMSQMEAKLGTTTDGDVDGSANGQEGASQASTPGFSLAAALAAVALVGIVGRRD